nr:N-acetylglucosamine-6-phosphate deacetylase [Microbacterium mangrovi]
MRRGIPALVVHSATKVDADGAIEDFWLAAADGVILGTGRGSEWRQHAGEASTVDAGGRRLVPGFIDLHGHGGGGFAFEQGRAAIETALRLHRRHGTTRSVLSLVTNPIDELCAGLDLIAGVAASDPLVLGSHLEGPFLAAGHRGAHNPAFLRPPDDPAIITDLLAAARGTLRQITLAPELPGALDAIETFREAGVVVAVGHTDATMAETQAAFDRGATLLTHAFNGMPGIGHRAPGPVLAALDDERVTLELIVDGFHVHPDVVRMAMALAPHRVALITDAMAAAGAGDGTYDLGSLTVTVTDGQAWLADGSSIAGSTLTHDRALRVAVEDARVDEVAAVEALTLTPARVLGQDDEFGRLAPGFAADLVLLDDALGVERVWAAGVELV